MPALPGKVKLTAIRGSARPGRRRHRERQGPTALPARVSGVFAFDGPLSSTLAGFEPREGQRAVAEAVASVVEDGGTLLAEAGTGTGKTLAYLVPAILS